MTEFLQSEAELAEVLVRIGRECESPIEHLRAEQLIREARAGWPGEESAQWMHWLAEACRSLNLRVTESRLDIDQACRLAEDGAAVVGAWRPDHGPILLLDAGKRGAAVAEGEIDGRLGVSRNELKQAISESPAGDHWLVVEHAEKFVGSADAALSKKPITRLVRILRPEWNDIWLILVFAFVAGLLSLSTPIAVEALVNTVAFGRVLQPVVVLAGLLFGFLAFAAVMQAMQTYVAEIIQRRLYARVSADLAHRLPRVRNSEIGGAYGPELVNRFLDVVTVQKVVAQLLLDGVSIVLTALVGMTVLAFYHPWLLGFDVLLLGLVVTGLVVLGRGAIRSGIDESKLKYKLTAWYEDLTRCGTAFKPSGGAEFAIDRANQITGKYLDQRRRHFSVVFRQILFVLGLQAVAGTVLLGGGGWLVIQGQLSLGQLVAAELIVSTILGSLAKTGKHLEGFYDLVAAIDKLGTLFDLPLERHDGLLTLDTPGAGLPVRMSGVRVEGTRGQLATGLSLSIEPGERIALLGPSASGKSKFCQLLYGEIKQNHGRLTMAGVDPTDLRPDVLRSVVGLAGETEIFEGTIADNVHLRRRQVDATKCRAALDAVGMLNACLRLPDGLDTLLTPAAAPLASGQRRQLMVARALAGDPKLLLIDGTLDGMPDEELERTLDALLDNDRGWSLVVATGRQDIAKRLDRIVMLAPNSNRPQPGYGARRA